MFKFILSIGFLFLSSPSWALQYIVKYRSELAPLNLVNSNYSVLDHHLPGQFYVLDIQPTQLVSSLVQLTSQTNVEYVVPNRSVQLFAAPSFSFNVELRKQWAVEKVQAAEAWRRAGNQGSREIKVAVIDTGADYKHLALVPNMVQGYNFIENNNDPMDIVSYGFPGHGTHCSGVIGASGLHSNGTIGMSPQVSIMPLRFINDEGGLISDGIRAIDFAIEKQAHIISASWGNTMSRDDARPLLEAIQRAEKTGLIFVTAAANNGKNNDVTEVYPANARLSNTISVAATDSDDTKPSWSNYGRKTVDIAAPGKSILSTLPGNRYASMDGTSMAAPLVAGVIALLKAQDKNLTPSQLRSLIQATGDQVNVENACNCRINAFKAVDQLITKKMFVSPYAQTLAIGEKRNFEAVFGVAPFNFSSLNPVVASIDEDGVLTGLARGETEITIQDSAGTIAKSYKIYIE